MLQDLAFNVRLWYGDVYTVPIWNMFQNSTFFKWFLKSYRGRYHSFWDNYRSCNQRNVPLCNNLSLPKLHSVLFCRNSGQRLQRKQTSIQSIQAPFILQVLNKCMCKYMAVLNWTRHLANDIEVDIGLDPDTQDNYATQDSSVPLDDTMSSVRVVREDKAYQLIPLSDVAVGCQIKAQIK